MTRRHYGLETQVLFIDLIKAFDLVNYEIMYKIFAKYGVPTPLVNVIKKMVPYCSIQLSAGKEKEHVKYGAGVQQGDNMAPPLFLFIIQAACKTFETISNPAKLEFRHHPTANHPTSQRGRLQGQETNMKWKPLLINNLLHVDNGALTFSTQQDLEKVLYEYTITSENLACKCM